MISVWQNAIKYGIVYRPKVIILPLRSILVKVDCGLNYYIIVSADSVEKYFVCYACEIYALFYLFEIKLR